MTFDHTIVRDTVILNSSLAGHLEGMAARGEIQKTSTICLCARAMRVTEPFTLTGWNLLLIAEEFDGSAGRIELRPQGARIDGMELTIICHTFGGVSAVLPGAPGPSGAARGAKGAPGKPGPQGRTFYRGDCTNQLAQDCPGLDDFGWLLTGDTGHTGGPGQQGLRGGAGGVLVLKHVGNVAAGPPVLDAPGGHGGPGGPGGKGGWGTVEWTWNDQSQMANVTGRPGSPGDTGPEGPRGDPGPAGRADVEQIDDARFWTEASARLADAKHQWVSHRLAIADFLYRGYNPAVPGRATYLGAVQHELDAVRRLDPDNTAPARIEAQIMTGNTALGLPRDLDITPDFDRYITAYNQWGTPVFGTLQAAVQTLMHAETLQAMVDQLRVNRQQVDDTIAVASRERDAAKVAHEVARKEDESAKSRMEALRKQVEDAAAEMDRDTIDIGGIIGTVGAIAGAVVAVVGAIPSGGTSLIALAPSVIALSQTVLQGAPAIVGELFKSEQKHLDQVKEAYKDVKKNVDAVIGAGKAVVSLVEAVQKLAKGTTSDNRRHVELVQAAASAAHGYMLSQLRSQQTDLQLQALQEKVDRATALSQRINELQQQTTNIAALRHEGALSLIKVAHLQRDTLLTFAFLAQRSVEIYTLIDQTAHLFLDSGYVHPDVEQNYIVGLIPHAELTNQYQLSWTRFLSPLRMQAEYIDYFTDPAHELHTDIRRLSITDPEQIKQFVTTRRLTINLDMTDLPDDRIEAKIQGVAVGLPGATSTSNVVTCVVQHGPVYGQRGAHGILMMQNLRSRSVTVAAQTSPLRPAGVDFTSGDVVTAPRALALWGRGVVGDWELTVDEHEILLHNVELDQLAEIQLWIGYQFRNAL